MNIFKLLFVWIFCALSVTSRSQILSSLKVSERVDIAFPFLLINPDSRLGGLGDAGAALLDDENAQLSNPSKIVYIPKNSGFSVSYSPWMKSLAKGINLGYLSGYYKLTESQAIGGSLRYLSLGTFELTDQNRASLGVFKPSQMALDFSYAQGFGSNFSLATTVRYIRSGLQVSSLSSNNQISENNVIAVDVSSFVRNNILMFSSEAILSGSISISNISPKVTYSETVKQFLPTNLKVGVGCQLPMDNLSVFNLTIDFNKLLVPSITTGLGIDGMIYDQSSDVSVLKGMFSSFFDAPGGLAEELREISTGFGMEYIYNEMVSLRTGFYYESPQKGYRRYVTFGTGFCLNNLNLDLAYIAASTERNPLANTLRFTLGVNF